MRKCIVLVALTTILVHMTVLPQARTSSPEIQQDVGQAQEEAQARMLELHRLAALARATAQLPQQRGGGPSAAPANWLNADDAKVRGAWWTNTALVQRLGLSDDQRARIEHAFENHRLELAARTETLTKEEAQLAKLLEADPLDRNAVYAQIDRVTQARAELERANSVMTLEMREVLTRAQWLQLQSPPITRVRVGGSISANNLISRVDPVSPAGMQGAVVLEAEISREGAVESLRVLSGDPTLAQAAVAAVKQWRYKPTLLNGQPVPVVTEIRVNFPFTGDAATAPTGAPGGPGQRRGR
jgi:TonB family protein